MALIYHITTQEQWRKSLPRGQYTHESLRAEGFIHCSTRDQVLGVANAKYAGQDGLALLCIDTSDILAVIQYETAAGSPEAYPHIYGPVNHDAVKQVVDFPAGADGAFALPEDLP